MNPVEKLLREAGWTDEEIQQDRPASELKKGDTTKFHCPKQGRETTHVYNGWRWVCSECGK